MKAKLAVASLATALLGVATPARADNLAGSIGVGYDRSIGGANGLSVQYVATPALHIQGIFSLAHRGETDAVSARTTFELGLYAAYAFVNTDTVDLLIGGGLNIGRLSDDDPDVSKTTTSIEVGIGPEWFLMPNVSLSARAGLLVDISGQSDDYPTKGFGIGVFAPTVDLTGSLGFHYYF